MGVQRHIIIVGGGTAGWLTALIVRRYLNPVAVSIQVIESSAIGTIGVGEGSTGLLASIIRDPAYRLDESVFFRETGATFKLGTQYINWGSSGSYYWSPIDNPNYCFSEELGGFPLLQAVAIAKSRTVSAAYLNGSLLAASRAPVLANSDGIELLPTYAYHFDAHALAKFLTKSCLTQGIKRTDGVVKHARLDDCGKITAIVLDSGQIIAGDFFIDCSGFRRILIQSAMGASWTDYRDFPRPDRALTFVDKLDSSGDVPLYTAARAMSSGWMWSIPTQSRIGRGYVYSSQYIDDETALTEAAAGRDREIEPQGLIRFSSGRLNRPFIKNCAAIGLSAGFLEPLEATSIHSSIIQAKLLAEILLNYRVNDVPEHAIEMYNSSVTDMIDDFSDFIALHYRCGRIDSQFWAACSQKPLSAKLSFLLDIWRTQFPEAAHFGSASSAVSPNLYLPVLDGLGLTSARNARNSLAKLISYEPACQFYARARSFYREVAAGGYHHRQALDSMMQRGNLVLRRIE